MSRVAARRHLGPILAVVSALLALALPTFHARTVWAQTIDHATSAPARAEAGQPFVVELRVASESRFRAEDPSLTPPIGLAVSPPSVSFFSDSIDIQGVTKVRMEYRARWTVRARDPGAYRFEPPSVTIDGKRIRSNGVTVEVGPPGSGSSASPPGRTTGPMWPFGMQMDDDEPQETSADLDLPAPPAGNPRFFLRMVADKTSAVIGEQVNLTIYLYSAVRFEPVEEHAPPLTDFLQVRLTRDPGVSNRRRGRVGDRVFDVHVLERLALFPLKAGKLSTGTQKYAARGVKLGALVKVESDDVVIDVSEPPKQGRPPGYVIGDVGVYALEADVKPRDVEVGGSFAVTVKLSGQGNVPASVRMPKVAGVEWLDPEKTGTQSTQGGRVGGTRTFRYLGKVTRGGYVELGKVELPAWDPVKKAYAIASADLGGIRVEGASLPPAPSTSASAGASRGSDDPLAQLPAPRTEMSSFTRTRAEPLPILPVGLALVAPPLLVAMLFGGVGAARAAKRRADAKRDAPTTRVKEALDEARAADAAGGEKAVAAAVERATHASIEAHTGVRSRGVLLRELRAELVSAGVADDVAERAASVLNDAESLRFDPGADAAKRSGLVDRARDLDRALAKDAARRGTTS